MPTTKYKLAEQIIRILKGGNNPSASSIKIPEIMEAIGQAINARISAAPLSSDPRLQHIHGVEAGSLVIASYTVSVTTAYGTYSKLDLPAIPCRVLKEDKDIGLYEIHKTEDPFNPFIIVPEQGLAMISAEPLISDMLGQIACQRRGKEVIFNKNLPTETPAVNSVTVRLLVVDVSQLSDYDILPIPADMELAVIGDVVQVYGIEPPANNKVDPISENKQQVA